MSESERPTNAEKAEAGDRFIREVDEAVARIHAAMAILRERQARGASSRVGPLFSFVGDRLYSMLDEARDDLWAAHKECASFAYDEHRAAGASPSPDLSEETRSEK